MPNVTALYAAALAETEEQCKLAPIFSMAEPILGTYTFHEIMIIVSAITAILSVIISLGQAIYHLMNFVVCSVSPITKHRIAADSLIESCRTEADCSNHPLASSIRRFLFLLCLVLRRSRLHPARWRICE
jgi:hypothetical protein